MPGTPPSSSGTCARMPTILRQNAWDTATMPRTLCYDALGTAERVGQPARLRRTLCQTAWDTARMPGTPPSSSGAGGGGGGGSRHTWRVGAAAATPACGSDFELAVGVAAVAPRLVASNSSGCPRRHFRDSFGGDSRQFRGTLGLVESKAPYQGNFAAYGKRRISDSPEQIARIEDCSLFIGVAPRS